MTFTPERAIELSIDICREIAARFHNQGQDETALGALECARELSERLSLIKFTTAWVKANGPESVDLINVDPDKLEKFLKEK